MIKIFLIILFLFPFYGHAIPYVDPISNFQDIITAIGRVIDLAVPVVIGLAFIFFLYGMMKFILVAGDEKGREQGKRTMLWGIIAIFVMGSVWGIVEILQSNFGITVFEISESQN